MTTDQDLAIPPAFLQETSPVFDSAVALQLLAALRLNSASINCSDRQPPAMEPPCTKCSSTSNKRHSPSSSSPQQPASKRAALHQPSSSTKSSGVHGFTRMPLSSPALSRTLSAPVPSPGTNNLNDRSSNEAVANSSINNRLPEENSRVNSAPVPTPSQQPLYRSFSEPIPDSYQLGPASAAARRPPAAGAPSLKQESPDSKRLKRMKDRLREMNKWWDDVIKEGEEDADAGSENNDHCLPKDGSEASEVSETEEACQEAVWVESKGEILILHFKCPCGKGYQILLSGNNCYYKLTSF